MMVYIDVYSLIILMVFVVLFLKPSWNKIGHTWNLMLNLPISEFAGMWQQRNKPTAVSFT